jgi:hypothetical protein
VTIQFVFLIIAFLCFIAAAANFAWPRVNLIGLGLAFWVLTLLIK